MKQKYLDVMKQEHIDYGTAKMAHEKSFPFAGNDPYIMIRGERRTIDHSLDDVIHNGVELPNIPQTTLKRWLREKFNIYVEVEVPWFSDKDGEMQILKEDGFGWTVAGPNIFEETFSKKHRMSTYEGALEKGLQEALKLI